MFGILDSLIAMISGRSSMKRSRKTNTNYYRTTVKPLKSRYSYCDEVDKRMIDRAKRRRSQNR